MRIHFQKFICGLIFQTSLVFAFEEVEFGIVIPIPEAIVESDIRPLEKELYQKLGKNSVVPNIPHITIFQLRTTPDKLPEILNKLTEVLMSEKGKSIFRTPIPIHMNIPFIRSGAGNHKWIDLVFTDRKVLPQLFTLHYAISHALAPFRTNPLKRVQDVYESLQSLQQKCVRQIGLVGGIFYTPHMTIFYNTDHDISDEAADQIAKEFTRRPNPLRFSFQLREIVIGELGEEGNMVKILHTLPAFK